MMEYTHKPVLLEECHPIHPAHIQRGQDAGQAAKAALNQGHPVQIFPKPGGGGVQSSLVPVYHRGE